MKTTKLTYSESEMVNGFKIWTVEDMPRLVATVHTEDFDTDDEAEQYAIFFVESFNNRK